MIQQGEEIKTMAKMRNLREITTPLSMSLGMLQQLA
jgi:hypothetical protein